MASVGVNCMAKGGKDENGKSIAAKNMGAKAMAKGGKDENGKSIAGGECPLCRCDDGGTHTLGGCTHRRMKAAYIARHNRAVQRIAKAPGNWRTAASPKPH
ncbi:hypothetical protein CHLRE_02g141046v5 [Chlamydomonas reinhardtii]|uniref:Uncharacterized protein n=1 Tax=Chlamydomonas reinhardtii TaxID=3055 RepID=A0A2K3E458_CHLRE|nr:uncharacterized protein CHLRE_02g141046v5 [Chlamydomonas reinhardtii]PNW87574.1 hypothetical protein CHLRE_02g141046v5 [Chlamydomonas reinhardtii]